MLKNNNKTGNDDTKELISCSLYHSRPILKISSKSYWTYSNNIVNTHLSPIPLTQNGLKKTDRDGDPEHLIF